MDVQQIFWTSKKVFGRPKITWTSEEFLGAMDNDKVVDILIELGLGEEKDLFHTLDAESAGVLTLEQFFDGLSLIMKGHEIAKAKDIVPLI